MNHQHICNKEKDFWQKKNSPWWKRGGVRMNTKEIKVNLDYYKGTLTI